MESQKATAPPKDSYVTHDGKTVKIKPDTAIAQQIRSKPSSEYRPEVVQKRTVTHITEHHYHHDYDWYYRQPTFYVGGGYSSAFWWMMMEWDAERRARWLYNNQAQISADAYQRGVQDAEVAAKIRQWEAEKRARQQNYIDPEFEKDPSLMMDSNYVAAVYNPQVAEPVVVVRSGWGVGTWLLVIFLVGGMIILLVVVATRVRF